MQYFNGRIDIEAYDINKLADLSQEEANNLACGPQDIFFNYLENVNNELNAYGIESIEVTDNWNWKAGSYDKIKDYLYKNFSLTNL